MVEIKDRIYRYMKELVAIPSVSDTEYERAAADYIEAELNAQPYFAAHPQMAGSYALKGDHLKRTTPYGLIKGSTGRTIILTGHYDVVDTREYGSFESFAYDVEAWKRAGKSQLEALAAMLPREAREDLESGEWLFGRGVNDMKGGLAIAMALMDWYGRLMLEHPQLPGCLLFAAVADEEAYSAGMRGSIPLFTGLLQEYGLEYACLLDLEPSFNEEGKQQVYIGSVGKTMPAVLVQGAKAHVVNCFHGLNAVGVLAEMFMRTELAPEFSEQYEGEPCPPPTWFNLRDRKEGYDVSVPLRAAGYMSMLGFNKTADSVTARLKEIGRESFSSYLKRMEAQEACVKSGDILPKVDMDRCVMEYGQLVDVCHKRHGEEAGKWFRDLYETAQARIRSGEWNYPKATLEIMDAVLTYSEITAPLMVISFAPPYYPAYHSDRIPDGAGRDSAEGSAGGVRTGGGESTGGGSIGREGAGGESTRGGSTGRGSALYEILAASAETVCGIPLGRRNYCCGISDLSYCGGPDREEMASYAVNAPLWGTMYRMDLDAMAGFQVPALLFGPVGKDAHQMSERVNARSLLEEVPGILQYFIEQVFANGTQM